MSTPRSIYKIKDKKLEKILGAELERKTNFLENVTINIKSMVPKTISVSYTKSPWNGRIAPKAILFECKTKIDRNVWKEMGYAKFKGRTYMTYLPKRTGKAGKLLSDKVGTVLKSEQFFQDPKIKKILNYGDPEETVKDGVITMYSLSFGHRTEDGHTTFMFSGYPGYEAPKGVEEILISEYNRLMA